MYLTTHREKSYIKFYPIKILLVLILFPIVIFIYANYLAGETERALSEKSRLIYSGPQDVGAFINRIDNIVFVNGEQDLRNALAENLADAGVSIERENELVDIYFLDNDLSSMLAAERVKEALSNYILLCREGLEVSLYSFDKGEYTPIYDSVEKSIETSGRNLLGLVASLLILTLLSVIHLFTIEHNSKINSDFSNGTLVNAMFWSIRSVFYSIILSSMFYLTFVSLRSFLLPMQIREVFSQMRFDTITLIFILCLFFSLGLNALYSFVSLGILRGKDKKGYSLDLIIGSVIFLFAATLLVPLSNIKTSILYFIPIFNLQSGLNNVIINGFGFEDLVITLAINLVFIIACLLASLLFEKNAKNYRCEGLDD